MKRLEVVVYFPLSSSLLYLRIIYILDSTILFSKVPVFCSILMRREANYFELEGECAFEKSLRWRDIEKFK